jgi:septal ring factor EnvC (AmiA/AmiB activator)
MEKTPTQILKEINDLKSNHDKIKSEILTTLDELKQNENNLNRLLSELDKIEIKYVELMEILINK